MSSDERDEFSRKQIEEHERQWNEFSEGYKQNLCYLCEKPFSYFNANEPCLHWLLAIAPIRKKPFSKIFDKYDYVNIDSYLRWCANMEVIIRNINDLKDEAGTNNIISCTIKWKNVEWAMICKESDYKGHGAGSGGYPHYHFQMRINGKPFICFNDYHIKLSDKDMFKIETSCDDVIKHIHTSKSTGVGELFDRNPYELVDHSESTNSDNAIFKFTTMIHANKEGGISGEEIHKIYMNAKQNKTSFAKESEIYFRNTITSVTRIIEPSEIVPEMQDRPKRN